MNWRLFLQLGLGGVRVVGIILVVIAIVSLLDAARDELRGVADAKPPTRSARRYVVRADENPDGFRHLMIYQWGAGLFYLAGGCFLLGIVRRAQQQLPFSTSFGNEKSLDELHDYLTREEERMHRPFHIPPPDIDSQTPRKR